MDANLRTSSLRSDCSTRPVLKNIAIMEYDSVIKKIGGFGRYQKTFLFVVSLASMFNAMTTFGLTFAFGEHVHRCKVPNDNDYYTPPGEISFNTSHGVQSYNVTECHIQINGTMSKCNSWVYDKSLFTATMISKFDIVCEEKFFRAHFLMAHYIGLLVGSVVCGFLSDTIGRKPVMAIGIVMLLISTGIRPSMPNLTLVTILEFFNGTGSIIYYITPFVLLTEMVGPTKRLLVSFCVYFTFCIGNYILLLMAFLIRDWTLLYWAITVPIGAYIIVLFFISESPRWLLSRGRTKEAIEILEKMARFNGNIVHISPNDIIMKDFHRASFKEFITDMVKSKRLMYRLAVLCINWFALNLTYYGISMNVAKFGGNIFVNFAISSLAEVVGIIVCVIIGDRLGRKYLFCSNMILAGITCICTIFTSLYADDSLSWLTTTLAMVGKFFNTITFFMVYIYTAELFPTVLRASVIGVSSMAGRAGSITSAYIGELGSVIPTKVGIALPLTILGVTGLVAGLLALTLPETRNTLLPESVDDAKEIDARKYESETESQELDYLTEKI